MWRRTAWIIVIGLPMSWLSNLRAEDHGAPERLITHLRWVRFEVIGGRIRATRIRVGQHRHQMTKEYPDGGTEALAVALDNGALSLRYTWQRRTEYLSVLAGRKDRLEFCWRRETTGGQLVETTFVQPPRGDMTLAIRRTGQTKATYCVPGVWHLAALHPDVCMEHVVPIMELLCADSPIRLEVEQLRDRLFETARKPLPVQRRAV